MDDLSVGESHGAPPVDRSVEVSLEVAITLRGRVVEEAPVELHDELAVVGIAIDDARRRQVPHLPPRPRQPVGPLDPREVAVLEHRARPVGHVGQDAASQARRGTRCRADTVSSSLRAVVRRDWQTAASTASASKSLAASSATSSAASS